MSPLERSVLLAWSIPIAPTLFSLLGFLLYVRGWSILHRTRPQQFPVWRLGAFVAGLVSIYIALGSPLDAFDDVLLSVHMMQHLILMSVAPPLLLLGYPTVPILRGLPRWSMRAGLAPILASPALHRIGSFLTRPAFAWTIMLVAFFGWHTPPAFELAIHSEHWHELEHACFLITSLLFWWPVIRPWPSKPRHPQWFLLPYLLSADVANTILCALLAFSGHVFYPSYALVQRPIAITTLQDQVAAGVLMWVLGSIPFLAAVVILTVNLLSPTPETKSHYAGMASH